MSRLVTDGDDPPGPADEVDAIADAWRRERPGTPVGSIGVVTRVWRVARLLREQRRRTLSVTGCDSVTLDLLSTLRRAGPPYVMAAGDVARASLITAGAVSQRVAAAERRGLVRRSRDPDNSRRVLVALTPTGHDVVERTVDDLLRHEEDLLRALAPEEREVLADLLRRLLADLESRTADAAPS